MLPIVGRLCTRVRVALASCSYSSARIQFVHALERLAAEDKYAELVILARRHPLLTWEARRALAAPGRANPEDLLAAELIGRGLIGIDSFTPTGLRDWVLPLLRESSSRYLPKTLIGHFLCEHLHEVERPEEVVQAIEASIKPKSWDDYSTFDDIFSMNNWIILRRHVTKLRLLTELDLFVTRRDREQFWAEFQARRPPYEY